MSGSRRHTSLTLRGFPRSSLTTMYTASYLPRGLNTQHSTPNTPHSTPTTHHSTRGATRTPVTPGVLQQVTSPLITREASDLCLIQKEAHNLSAPCQGCRTQATIHCQPPPFTNAIDLGNPRQPQVAKVVFDYHVHTPRSCRVCGLVWV